jgi:hypothetical protein
MDTIEELGRRAGQAALAAAAQVTGPDDGLRRIMDDAGPLVPSVAAPRPARRPSRRWALVAAAAAIVGIGSTAVVIAGRDDTTRLSPDPTPTPITTAPAPPTSLATTPPTEPPTTTLPVTTGAIGVSYLDPPPELALQPFARLPIAEAGSDGARQLVVAEDGVLVRTGDRTHRFATWDGTWTDPIQFDVALNMAVAAGPGQVVYGTVGDPMTDFRFSAVAFGGARSGEELVSIPVTPSGGFLGEGPWGQWAHGATGVAMRSNGQLGPELSPYVDETGAPLSAPIVAPNVFLSHTYNPDADVVRSLDGARRWELQITAHPDAPSYDYEGFPQAIPTLDGGAIVWREIGEIAGSADFGRSNLAVVAVLRPDGGGSWFTVPDGWQIASGDLWGTVLVKVEADELLLARLEATAPASTDDLCARSAELVVHTLVSRRLAGETGADCLDLSASGGAAEPPCWIECVDGRLTAAEAGVVSETFNPVTNEDGWSVAVTFTNEFGFRTQRREGWTMRRGGDGRLAVTAVDVTANGAAAAESEAFVREYLEHVAAGRYDEAAALLGAGEAPFADRPDLQQLGPQAEADVAGALRAWCEAPGVGGARPVCTQPGTLSTNITSTTLDVTAWYVVDGRIVTATFGGGTSEGIPFVRGVPPLARPFTAQEVGTLATGYRATRMVVPTSTGFWLAADGSAVFVDTGAAGWPWIEGDFAYWTAWGEVGERSSAFRLDGTEVCTTDGVIHHVRERAEGGYVATVERPTGAPLDSADTPVPAFAVDCATGDVQPIAPISWTAEARSRSIVDVGDRTFTSEGDAEGNVVITNESGVRVTGPAWAITADFTADGATVVYGEGGAGDPGVHDTNRLVARDTATGAVSWSVSLPQRFSTFWIVSDQVVVAHEPPIGFPTGMVHASFTIISLTTGDILASGPAMLQVHDMS